MNLSIAMLRLNALISFQLALNINTCNSHENLGRNPYYHVCVYFLNCYEHVEIYKYIWEIAKSS